MPWYSVVVQGAPQRVNRYIELGEVVMESKHPRPEGDKRQYNSSCLPAPFKANCLRLHFKAQVDGIMHQVKTVEVLLQKRTYD